MVGVFNVVSCLVHPGRCLLQLLNQRIKKQAVVIPWSAEDGKPGFEPENFSALHDEWASCFSVLLQAEGVAAAWPATPAPDADQIEKMLFLIEEKSKRQAFEPMTYRAVHPHESPPPPPLSDTRRGVWAKVTALKMKSFSLQVWSLLFGCFFIEVIRRRRRRCCRRRRRRRQRRHFHF